MKTYRKKPVTVRAVLLTDSASSIKKCLEFMNQKVDLKLDYASDAFERYCRLCNRNGGLSIDTLEGTMLASFGDYIIKGVDGEYYPCKPDIFRRAYEEVLDE